MKKRHLVADYGSAGNHESGWRCLTLSCLFQGFYMYIETSRPRKEGDQARLVSPFFNVAPKNPYSISNPPAYCFGFFYHMYGKHIGELCQTAPFKASLHLQRVTPLMICVREVALICAYY